MYKKRPAQAAVLAVYGDACLMFSVLQISAREKDILSRIRERFSPSEPEITETAVKNGAPFFIIRVKDSPKGLPWESIRRNAGRAASRMLLPGAIEPPPGYDIERFEPAVLPVKLIFNSACEALKHCGVKPALLSAAVVDFDAALAGDIARLFKYVSTVKAVTSRPKPYEEAAETIMEDCGAALVITDDPSSAVNCSLVITAQSAAPTGCEKGAVFAAFPPSGPLPENLVTGFGVELPAHYANYGLSGIGSLEFAAALYELCGVKSLGLLAWESLVIGSERVSVYKAASLIRPV